MVPALLVVLRVEIATALATSLVAIALISASALVANAAHLHPGDLRTGLFFLAGAAAGMTGGVAMKKRIPDAVLEQGSGWAVVVVATITAAKTYLA